MRREPRTAFRDQDPPAKGWERVYLIELSKATAGLDLDVQGVFWRFLMALYLFRAPIPDAPKVAASLLGVYYQGWAPSRGEGYRAKLMRLRLIALVEHNGAPCLTLGEAVPLQRTGLEWLAGMPYRHD